MSSIHPFCRSEQIAKELQSDRWVYRYQSLDSAIRHVVCERGTLRLNTFAQMNDPRESKQWAFTLESQSDWIEPNGASTHWFTRVSHALSHWTKVLCVSLDNAAYIGTSNEEFGRGFLKPRMWAQYGDSHRGVCLVFEKQRVGESVRSLPVVEVIEGNVHYDFVQSFNGIQTYFELRNSSLQSFSLPDLVSDGDDALLEQIRTKVRSVYFAKHEDWAAENEYRWIALRPDDEPLYAPIAESLAGIVIGQDADMVMTEELIKTVRRFYPEVPIVQFHWATRINKKAVLHLPSSINPDSFW